MSAQPGRGDVGDLLRLLVGRLDDVGLATLDPEGTIVFWSEAAERLTGLAASAAVGASWGTSFAHAAVADELLRHARDGRDVTWTGPRGAATQLTGTLTALRDGERLLGFGERLSPPAGQHPDRRIVQALTSGLAAARTVQDVVDAFIRFGLPSLGGRGGALALLRPDGRSLEFVDATTSPGAVQPVEKIVDLAGHTVTARAFRERRPIWLSSMDEYRALAGVPSPSLVALDARGFAALPLAVDERMLGVIVVETAPTVDPGVREASEAMAQACGLALDRIQLAERERAARVALDDAHRQLHDLSESLPMLVWTLGPDGALEYLNGAGRTYVGGARDEAGRLGLAPIHPDDQQRTIEAFRAALTQHRPFEVEQRLRRHDGAWRWHLARAVPIFDAHGALRRWYGSTTDIDDLKRTEQRLREAEAHVRLALEAGRMGTWTIDHAEGLMATSGLTHVFGAEGPGTFERWLERIHPDDRETSMETFRTARRNGTDFTMTQRVATSEAGERWVRCHGRIVRDAGGRAERVVGVSRDVTEEREAERLLRESESWIRSVADATPAIVWCATSAGRITYRNARFFDYAGVPPDGLERLRLRDIVHPDDLDEGRRRWLATIQDGVPLEHEVRLRRADGTYRWHLTRATRLQSAIGPAEWVASATDIDDQRRAITEREELLARTREAVRGREVFLAVAAHELRTPLTPLRLQLDGILRALRDDEPTLDRVTQRMQVAARQVRRLEALVGALLDVSRLASGRLEIHAEPHDLSVVVAEALERHRHETVVQGQLLLDAPDRVNARIDRLRVEQIVSNLVSNALKYGLGSQVRVAVTAHGDRASISVADDGPGIAQADLARIFERFERATDERHYGGLGLGLWIVRHLAQALGGSVGVESEPGRGATFVVDLPLQQEGV